MLNHVNNSGKDNHKATTEIPIAVKPNKQIKYKKKKKKKTTRRSKDLTSCLANKRNATHLNVSPSNIHCILHF